MNASIYLLSSRRWSVVFLIGVLSMLLLPTLTHSILEHPPEYDELLHILAARGLNETGLPVIADGQYTRTQGYTQLIAWFTTFGDNELVMARLPALFFGMIATAMLTIWVGLRGGSSGRSGNSRYFRYFTNDPSFGGAGSILHRAHTGRDRTPAVLA